MMAVSRARSRLGNIPKDIKVSEESNVNTQ